MSKYDSIAEKLGLPIGKDLETIDNHKNLPSLPQIKNMPDNVKESLKRNKTELNEIYQHSKQLYINLINEAVDIARPRDVEVLSQFMGEISKLLKNIREVDKDIVQIDQGSLGDDSEKGKTINNILLAGDTRDLMNLVKTMRNKKAETIIEVKPE